MRVLGYEEWRKFFGVIEKAKEACNESGQTLEYHFVGSDKMIKIANGTAKETTQPETHIRQLEKQRKKLLKDKDETDKISA